MQAADTAGTADGGQQGAEKGGAELHREQHHGSDHGERERAAGQTNAENEWLRSIPEKPSVLPVLPPYYALLLDKNILHSTGPGMMKNVNRYFSSAPLPAHAQYMYYVL